MPLVLLLLASAASFPPVPAGKESPVEIVRFHPATGTLAPGEAAVSALVVRNPREEPATVWIGYSVGDPGGGWHDVPSHPLLLQPGELSTPQVKRWEVPEAGAVPGSYRVVMAVWSSDPREGDAVRLASADQRSAFRVDARASLHLAGAAWQSGNHRLGRGRVRPENVLSESQAIRLRLPAGRPDGAEIRTAGRVLHGEYSARMRTPRAPGSFSALFLYEDVPEGNDEIDLEILNDDSRRALLTTYADGEMTNHVEVRLPFDPGAAVHEYTLQFREGEVRFLADGVLLQRWTRGLPTRPMRLAINAWWPTWQSGEPADDDRFLWIEEIRMR